MEVTRIINENDLYFYRATQNEQRALQLQHLFGFARHSQWHQFIFDSFVRTPPHPAARFRPPFGKNVFYGSLMKETALYESAFYLLKERLHLFKSSFGQRTLFIVDADNKNSIDIRTSEHFVKLLHKQDYSASHQFIAANPQIDFLVYPSCRDPLGRENVAIFDINYLAKAPKTQQSIKFFYDNEKQQLKWLDDSLNVVWTEVS